MHVPIKFHVKNNCFSIKCFLKTTKVTRLASQTHWVHLLRAKIIFFHSSVLKRVPLLERSGILLPCLLTTSGASDIWPHSAACSSSSRKEKCFYVEMIHKTNSFRRVSFSSLVSFFDFTQLTKFSCPFIPEWKPFQSNASFWGLQISRHPQDPHHPQGTLPKSFQMKDAPFSVAWHGILISGQL